MIQPPDLGTPPAADDFYAAGGFDCNGLFTPPTRTRQNCLVLSRWWCEHNCRQDKTVLSRPYRPCERPIRLVVNWKLGRHETKLIETGSRQNKTVSSRARRRCKHAISDRVRQEVHYSVCVFYASCLFLTATSFLVNKDQYIGFSRRYVTYPCWRQTTVLSIKSC